MNMLETIARIICVAAGHDPDGPTCDIYVPGDPHAGIPWAGYREHARAVLTALETPTPEMVEAGKPWAGVAAGSAKRTFEAMIRAAKEAQ